MTWLFLVLVAAVLGALTRILQKILLSDTQSDPAAFAFVYQLTAAGLFLIYALITKSFEIPNLTSVIPNLIVMAFLYAVGNALTFTAFKQTQASDISIIFASSSAWAVVSSVLFLGESLTAQQVLGIGSILLGVVVINWTHTKWELKKGHLFAALAALCFGLAYTNDVYILGQYQSVASYLVVAFVLPSFGMLLLFPQSTKHLPHFRSRKVFNKVFLCSAFYALSTLMVYTAYKMGGQASIISPIHQSGLILTVILSYVLLKEHDHLPQKVIGTVLAFVGVVLVV